MTIWQPFQLFRHTNDAHLSNCFILETNACIFIITSRARLWWYHGLRTPGEEIAFTARPKINSYSQIFRYGRSIFCLPHRPKFSDFFDLCLHWVSVVRGQTHSCVIFPSFGRFLRCNCTVILLLHPWTTDNQREFFFQISQIFWPICQIGQISCEVF